MVPEKVSNPGPLTYESGALPILLKNINCKSSLKPSNQAVLTSIYVLSRNRINIRTPPPSVEFTAEHTAKTPIRLTIAQAGIDLPC